MSLPLHGRRIVVTRAREQAGDLIARLEALGAQAIALPTIVLTPPDDFAPLDRALGELSEFSGFIFTSANGARGFFSRARQIGIVPQRRAGSWICAIGPATAAALAEQPGWCADIAPPDSVAEGIVAALAGLPLAGSKILLPRAAEGRDLIPDALGRRCAHVVSVATHRSALPSTSPAQTQTALSGADAVLFTSSSTARNLAALLGAGYRESLRGIPLAAIGPITRRTLEDLGLAVTLEAQQATMESLVQSLVDFYSHPKPHA